MHRKHGHLEDPGVVDPPEGGEAAARQLMVAKDNLLALEAQLANAKAAVKDAQKAVASGNIEEEQ